LVSLQAVRSRLADDRAVSVVVAGGRPVGAARPRWWTQIVVIGAVLWAYDAINNLSALRRTAALAHGVSLVHLEARLHLEPELALNRWLATHVTLGRLVGDYYDLFHFAVTLSVLAAVWWRHPGRYRPARNALVLTNVIGFAVYWLFPVAPPRMLPSLGFVDVVAVMHSVGAWSSGALASQANEFAAMPSLHVAWAIWCAMAVWLVTTNRWARLGAAIYPLLTAVVVMATANHYFLDVAAGVVTAVAAGAVAVSWDGRRHRRRATLRADRATPDRRVDDGPGERGEVVDLRAAERAEAPAAVDRPSVDVGSREPGPP